MGAILEKEIDLFISLDIVKIEHYKVRLLTIRADYGEVTTINVCIEKIGQDWCLITAIEKSSGLQTLISTGKWSQ
ncbi:hypothetical protein DGG96_07435 [Legionella qingyii]|uniref:Uncharacterized protein n=1 Tax=Legionella qingyii TaxID=2184757 RepID=A0A317U4I8_9GAMM|nr:hypothetical protein [Legionella qingyii]PWY56319.1 hypothetical protein DGG96_07435 [Legionella qingyii]